MGPERAGEDKLKTLTCPLLRRIQLKKYTQAWHMRYYNWYHYGYIRVLIYITSYFFLLAYRLLHQCRL